MNKFNPTEYKLKNVQTGRLFEDTGWLINDPQATTPSLIRTIYEQKQLVLKPDSYGIYKFSDWLPVKRVLKGSSAPVTYKSQKLSSYLKMENLYITFSGYNPEKGVMMRTASFKETEAYSVCGRMSDNFNKILVVASAGNTARAFAQVCSENNIPLLLCVPEDNINALWFKEKINDCVKLICTPKGSDYFDAIHLSTIAGKSDRFVEEGGAKNVARRDGMATTVLSAATTIGKTPEAYFQAIGSGTGTIAAWEANLRLIEDGRFGSHKMRLYPSQNHPYLPMYEAWQANSRELLPMTDDESRQKASIIDAKVLSNRKPPYSVPGGLYDAMKDSDGDIEIADNQELAKACNMFRQLEGVDIHPAAGVALATMIKTLEKGIISPDETVMLNITGGGEELFKQHNKTQSLHPTLILDPTTEKEDIIIKKIEDLF